MTEHLFVLIQSVEQQVGQDPCVLRAHIDSRMDAALVLTELQQNLKRVMPNLKDIGIPAFLPVRGRGCGCFASFTAHFAPAYLCARYTATRER